MLLLEGLLSLLFPPRCGVCDRLRRPILCEECTALLQPIGTLVCPRCGKPGPPCAGCWEEPAPCRARYRYEGAAGAAVRRLKYDGVYALGPYLGKLLAEAVRDWPDLQEADLVIPVPIHPSRLRQRTFNQSELIAAPVAATLGVPMVPDALVRSRRTQPQVGKSLEERRANILGAFRVPNRGKVLGRAVLLVDDVFTSGYTLRECAEELKRAGASRTMALTVCREG